MNATAKFLVLLGTASRALLFDRDSRLLGEVIEDDGFIVESLLLNATACPVPRRGMLEAIGSSLGLPGVPVRCFELG